jgi:hypothetical protein
MRTVKMLLAILAALLVAAIPAYGYGSRQDLLSKHEAESWGQTNYGHPVYDSKASQPDKARNAWRFVRPGYTFDRHTIYGRPTEKVVAVRARITDATQSKVGIEVFVNGEKLGNRGTWILGPDKRRAGSYHIHRFTIPDVKPEVGSGGIDYVEIKIETRLMNAKTQHDGILIDWVQVRGYKTQGVS